VVAVVATVAVLVTCRTPLWAKLKTLPSGSVTACSSFRSRPFVLASTPHNDNAGDESDSGH